MDTHTQHTRDTHTMIWFRYDKEISEYTFVYAYMHLHVMTWGVKPSFYDFYVHLDMRQECTSHVNVHPSWYAVNRMGKHKLFMCGISPRCIWLYYMLASKTRDANPHRWETNVQMWQSFQYFHSVQWIIVEYIKYVPSIGYFQWFTHWMFPFNHDSAQRLSYFMVE